MDDTFIIWLHGKRKLGRFLTHLNTQRASIEFTVEFENEERIPFLDVEVRREEGRLRTRVFRKRNHMDLYLHFKGMVYGIPCECGEKYIGETGRTLETRLKNTSMQYPGATPTMALLFMQTTMTIREHTNVVEREPFWLKSKIKEALNL